MLDLYAQPSTPHAVRSCIDERPCQVLDDVIAPVPPKPGKVAKQDYEDDRKGTAGVLLASKRERGQRSTQLLPQRTKGDYAHVGVAASTYLCPTAPRGRLTQDNLNTHTAGAFYQAFDAPTTRHLVQRLECHYTPKHASWLNLAEIEFAALARQGLDRRLGSLEALAHEVAVWEADRTTRKVMIHWSFTVQDARDKLQRHYNHIFAKN
jgi:hypothetical protein